MHTAIQSVLLIAIISTGKVQSVEGYSYDEHGRLVAVERGNTCTLYTYDEVGNRTHKSTFNGMCAQGPSQPGGANAIPIARNDIYTVINGSSITVRPLSNDTDADGDTLTISRITQCDSRCVVAQVSPTQLRIDGLFQGIGRFTYTVSDGREGFATATVTVSVKGGFGGCGDSICP